MEYEVALDSVKEKKSSHEKMGMNQKIGVLFIAMVSAIGTGYVPGYLNLYYTDTVGISMGAVGIILMITKITDGFTDIIMGMIIDRTNTRLGKARPWVLAGGAGLALSILLLFNCPGSFSMGAKIAFCAAFYFLANPIFGTMISVSAGTLNNLLTADSRNRGILGVFAAYGSLFSVVLIGLVVPPVLSKLNESQQAYTIITLIFAGLAVIAAIVGVVLVRETVTEHAKAASYKNQSITETIQALRKNKYFLYLAIGTILYNLTAVPVATYYAKYIFKNLGLTSIVNLPGLLLVFMLPFAVPIITKFGKRVCIVGGMIAGSLGHIILFFANANIGLFMLGKVIGSIGMVPFIVALIPLTGEICDYALYKTGKPMDGTISSAATMGGKIGIGLAAGISSTMMAVSGYISSDISTNVVQPESAIFMIRALQGIYPAVLFALAAVVFWKIDMEKEHIEAIQAELKEKGLR